MRIAFFGFNGSFDLSHIGGMDSFARRLAISLVQEGHEVDMVHYGSPEDTDAEFGCNINVKYFKTIKKALEYLVYSNCEHVVNIYVRPRDRVSFALFRRKNHRHIKFHRVYSVWNESPVKRELLFAEAKIFPFNGCSFCLSPRIHSYVSGGVSGRSLLLFPPVNQVFFREVPDKDYDDKLRVSYVGRIDPGKGIDRVIDAFHSLADWPEVKIRISGYYWPHRPKTKRLHERLTDDHAIEYIPLDYSKWTPHAEEELAQFLRETDILLMPYQRLSSSIDTPLLFLEGMASLCSIITLPQGDLRDIYGGSYFNVDAWDTRRIVNLIKESRSYLAKERERLSRRNTALRFDQLNVCGEFKKGLEL